MASMQRKRIVEWLIITFCIWHMFCVAVSAYMANLERSMSTFIHDKAIAMGYCDPTVGYREHNVIENTLVSFDFCKVPFDKEYKPGTWSNKHFRHIIRPYMMALSQWQRWNLFSPDPLRRITQLHIQTVEDGTFTTIDTLGPGTVGWYQRSYMLKYIRRIEHEKRYEPLRKHLLAYYCKKSGMRNGTAMRMQREYTVIPSKSNITNDAWWRNWEPEWKTQIVATHTCT